MPFSADVSEGKNDPIYNAPFYHTKIPHKEIMRYILHYTEPGNVVFDGLCGTGMTGVAAQLCGDRSAVDKLGYSVDLDGIIKDVTGAVVSRIGTRKCVLGELSAAATFIARGSGAAGPRRTTPSCTRGKTELIYLENFETPEQALKTNKMLYPEKC